jgi:hypothetical protein
MQSMHWHSHQIIILIHISYHLNLDYELYDEDSKVLIEYHFYVLDDQKQNNEFVKYWFPNQLEVYSKLGIKAHMTLCMVKWLCESI